MGCKLSPIFLVFLIVSLIFPIVYAESFGEYDTGSLSSFFDAYIALEGSWTITEDGTGESMTAVVTCTEATHLFSMAVYNTSLYVIGYTDETSVSVGAEQTITLDFATGHVPTFEADTAYLFALWSNNPAGNLEYHYEDTGGTHRWNAYTYNYPNFEQPYTQDGSNSRLATIWCNYTTEAGQELTFGLFENFNTLESLATSKEQAFTFFQPFNLWSSLSHSVETAYQDLTFTLFENFNIWPYLATSKEQSFTFYEAINLWSSIIMTPEGVALDLYFTFFEAFNPYASLGAVIAEELTLEDVYGLAALAFIMAIVGICLAVAFKKK